MTALIDKKILEYLADLGRIKLNENEEEKLLKDLQNILAYFQELQKLDTTKVEPLTGGTIEKNVFREDKIRKYENPQKLIESFPEKENNFLKIPPVFG